MLQNSVLIAGLLYWALPPSLGGAARFEQANGQTRTQGPDHAATIHGKALEEWLAALKDRDPAVRKRAVEVVGERAVDPDLAQNERLRLQTAVMSVLSSDKDAEVRQAAAFFADLFKVSGSPEMVGRLIAERMRKIDPTRRVIHLVDAEGRPVEGAVAGTYFQRDMDRDSAFTIPEPVEAATSNQRGLVSLKIDIPGHLDGAGIYAIQKRTGRPLVGMLKVTRDGLDKPITISMHPACRVLFRVDSTGLPALEAKYRAELAGPGWWRAVYIVLGASIQGTPRPLFAMSVKGEFEFLLPPGQVTIHAYGSDVNSYERSIEIKPDDRELFLGTFDVPPSRDAIEGRFPEHRRVRQKQASGDDELVFRRIRYLALRGPARDARDVAFSPDGKLLATAHTYNADPGEVMLWNTSTGARIATLPLAERGVSSVAFSPDGQILAGHAHALDDPRRSREIVIWDVPARRELRRISSGAGRALALAFSPDGKMLASSGGEKAVRLWDPRDGRPIHRIDLVGSASALAFTRDGKFLAVADRGELVLWDLAEKRVRAKSPSELFRVSSLAISPDGRTLAAAGTSSDPKDPAQGGQARLYDLRAGRLEQRTVLHFDRALHLDGNPIERVPVCSDVVFTPDGARVVAVGMQMIRLWDVASGAVQDAFERHGGSSADRFAVSSDGRWLAVTSHQAGVSVIDISPSNGDSAKAK